MKKKYTYWIFYSFQAADGYGSGQGNATVLLDRKIKTVVQLLDLQREIEKNNECGKVVIGNWKKLKG